MLHKAAENNPSGPVLLVFIWEKQDSSEENCTVCCVFMHYDISNDGLLTATVALMGSIEPEEAMW